MASGTAHRLPHGGAGKAFAEALLTAPPCRRAESGAKLAPIQIPVKTRRAISHQAPVDGQHGRLLALSHAARRREDRQDAALVTARAVVIAIAEFPPPFARDR